MIIAFFGKRGSGKTTAAEYLENTYGFTRFSFATPLKEMLIKAGLCTRRDLTVKTPVIRTLLQKIATDIFRNQVDKDFWVKKAKEPFEALIKENNLIVVDDLRFQNEAHFLFSYGNTHFVKIERPFPSSDSHISEQFELADIGFDTIVNDEGFDELHNKIETWITTTNFNKSNKSTSSIRKLRDDIIYVCDTLLSSHTKGCQCHGCSRAIEILSEMDFQKYLDKEKSK